MKRIIDQAVILIYCFATVLLTRIDTAFLTAFLAAVIFACLNYFCSDRRITLLSSAIYMILSFFFPGFLLFLPVILYGILQYKNYIMLIPLGIATVWKLLPVSLPLFLFVLLGAAVALLLQYQTASYEELHSQYKKTRDDSTELTLLLKEKNQALLEKQDYETYTATLKERNRIAREIHDNVGHMLSRAILMTGAMKMINKDAALTEPLIQLEDTLNTAMTNVRDSVHDLHDDSINLKEALGGLIQTFTFCEIHMDYDMGFEIPKDIKYSFITIVKEALNNIIRHSSASCVHLIVREHPGLYQLVIEDNGTKKKAEKGEGLGLMNMKDRVDSLKGTMQIQDEKGFRIFITIPKNERT